MVDVRIEDRIAIADLTARYCEIIDEYRIEDMPGLFTEDCIFDPGPGQGGPMHGDDFTPMHERQSAFRRTQHLLGQQRLTFTGDDTASGLTYAVAWHERWDGSIVVARLRYVDEYVRVGPASWRIHRRRLEATGVEGAEADTWSWAPRRTPAGHA